MKEIGKYNLFKALSIMLTVVPPLFVAYCFGNMIVYDTRASISLAAIIAIITALFFLKNKILENFKVPSIFVIALILFILLITVEQIIVPAKWVCGTVVICCGLDELIFKRIYKRIEALLPQKREAYKHFGFYFCKTSKLMGDTNNEQN